MSYNTVIRKIIEKQEDTIGRIALQKVQSIEGINVEGSETDLAENLGKEDLEELMDIFKQIQGQGAVGIARNAISDISDEELEGLDLPEELE